MSKDRNAEWTKAQSFTLFKWTRKDFRETLESVQITYGELFDLIGQVITVAKNHSGDRADSCAAGREEAERLLANFPAK